MNKELFVSSTPHETKVGLVEDDLLAEIYLERENEYTLAGSIYKGRVTRVLPGMQSAFVDIGLERDAFLYVSDFMELEEHDEDMTDVVPAGREVPDLRRQNVRAEAPSGVADQPATGEVFELAGEVADSSHQGFDGQESHAELHTEAQSFAASGNAPQPGRGDDSQGSERGGFRGRRRRRGGRRDGRDGRDGREGRDRGSEQQSSRPAAESTPSRETAPPAAPSRTQESSRSQQYGPPAGYQPILLPGESISKYQRYAQQPPAHERRSQQSPAPVSGTVPERPAPLAATFPEDEPIFAKGATIAEPLHEQHEDSRSGHEEQAEAASTSVDWNREFRRQDLMNASPLARDAAAAIHETQDEVVQEGNRITAAPEPFERRSEHFSQRSSEPSSEHPFDHREPLTHQQQAPAFAAPGTIEEETIDEEEADTIRYQESSDDGYEEFEEETRAADQGSSMSQTSGQEIAEVREAVAEIHRASLIESSMAESGIAEASTAGTGGVSSAEPGAAEGEEDSEELELEEAQAEAEALLDAEARGNGTVDAHAEVRAPAGTVGYTQRAPRPRPGFDRQGGPRGRRGGRRFKRHEPQDVPKISDLLKEGQEILVQIAKEPIGKKGARITSHIALPGRFLVYMPTVNHTGVSRKIASDEERQRLKRIVMSERDNGHGGFIVRTAAQSASEEELRADIRFLKGLWNDIKTRSESSKPPALIYHDLNVVERVLRDQVTSDFSVIWVDTEPEYERILRFFNRFQPALVKRVKLYTKETPLFEQFGLAEEMNKALKSKVWLKSGGYIVINQTEALVAIDINTGKYVGKTSRLEDTIVKTNVDAIKEIVRQIRLRDLGGIIIIDFIDMDERRNRQRVMQALEEELRHDRAPSKVLQFNDFGLVAITRKRVKQSLERTIGAPCPYCQSTGYVKSVITICNEIYVEMRKIAKHLEHEDVMLRVNPDVAKELKSNNGRLLNEMEELTKRTIIVKSDPAVHQEQFDIH
jgi:Rne/Rng family ribonuclease